MVERHDKQPGYIPVGAAITSYARCFTIRAAQANYHGKDKPGFIYADTDSIHCDLPPDELVGVKEHPKNFCCWKFESCWDSAIFVRQKTYIEHITHENRELLPKEKQRYSIKCAGMPEKCKQLFIKSLKKGEKDDNEEKENEHELDEKAMEFISTKRTLEDFKVGLVIPGKLLPKRIRGGIVLQETTYEIR